MEGGQPDLVGVVCTLCPEKLFAPVKPTEGIILAIKHRKRKLVIPWYRNTLLVVFLLIIWVTSCCGDEVWNGSGDGECGNWIE
jgi:hypothetical protein